MPQAASIHLQTPISEILVIPTPTRTLLIREGIETAADLLHILPARHEDRRQLTFTGFHPDPNPVCHHLRILSTRLLRFGRSAVFEATTVPASARFSQHQLTLRWFGMPFMQRALAVDMNLIVYGKIKEIKSRLIIDHPDYEILLEEDTDPTAPRIHTGRIVPIYRLRGNLKQKPLRTALWHLLQDLDPSALPNLLPTPKATGEFSGYTRAKAIQTLHHPPDLDTLTQARRYLALEEFYLLQLRLLHHRHQHRLHSGNPQKPPGNLLQSFLQNLPFDLTAAQLRSLNEIRQDMADPIPMNRLLHGDVGSGKTVVALAAMLVAVESGHQAALMAPTQILAEQHYQNAQRWLTPLGLRVSLRTADKRNTGILPVRETDILSVPSDTTCTPKTHDQLPEHLPHILIGTHALLYDRVSLPQLSLAVIDEQHKFGVAQRARLIAQSDTIPDVLVMTATPIPRTLTLTLYGDLDVSTIDERPRERGKIITAVRDSTKLKDITAFLKTQLDEGRQAYIVHPLIEESEKLDASAAITGHATWSKRLKKHHVGLLHGRIDSETKDTVMRKFRDNEIQALVTTTVIEVGVDVPNATVMIIHDAARFGLAQLHQLRGRIGRGTHTSYCILLIDKNDEEARQKLTILEQTSDGFQIAEEDLRRRGPGDLLGSMQSGQAPLRFHELLADTRLLTLARQLATRTLIQDPNLTQPDHALLRPFVLDSLPVRTTLQ
ncbi:ATP-dependent DNA helicase RecG [Phragmitibacter flavus]|nr:ATP-dependent DNA helicase RecG [Phragmitibacter flavus]